MKGDMKMRALGGVFLIGALILSGCSGSQVSVKQVPGAETKPIHRIAIMPGSGILGDSIARELSNRGINVATANQTDRMVGGIKINHLGVTASQYYAALRNKGVDAAITATADMGKDGKPDKADAMVMDTTTGESLMDINWQNGWGGYGGSDADRAMRKSTSEAAQEMTKELVTRLRLY